MASKVNLVLASSRITLIASFIAAFILMPSGCWAQSTMSTTVHSDFFEGDVRIVVGPNRNQIRVQADLPGWAKSVTPKKEYLVETYPFPSNFSSLTDVKHLIMTFAPSNCYPIYNTTNVAVEQAVPAYLDSGTDICLSCYVYLTFSFLDVDTASQIGSECTETDNGKLRGYICSTDEVDDVTVAQAFGSPPVVNGGGTSVGFLYTEMFVRQPAGSTMRLPSIRVDPLAMKGIGYIMVPSKGPTPLPGTFDSMPFIAGNGSKAVGIGLVFPITLITQASLATTPFSSNTQQTATPTAFPALSMSAPANQSLTLNASIVPPAATPAAATPYNITFSISKNAISAYMPDWAKAVTPKEEYIVETYPFPSNFSSLTDVKHAILTFAPSNCYPIYNGTKVTEEQAIPAYLASGPDFCLSCYVYLTFSLLDVDTASQIGSECTETNNGKLRGYICSTDEGDDVTVAQAFGSPPVVNGGGTSVGFLYTEMFVRQPAGSTMRLPSIRVDPLAMKGIGYIMVPSKGPTPLPGTFDAMPFIAGNDSKSVGVGLVFPITLMTQASLATTPFSSNTVQTVTPTAFPALSMSAPANQSLTVNASIIPPPAAGAAAGAAPSSYNISLSISKDALPVRGSCGD
ncbi:unnamed protein product [Closterium sp. NIES-64]|nr:unnamed protein product [Closterium sp. NIES-64]